MNLPQQYSYNPRFWLIILPIGAGLVWIALEGLECGCMPHGISSFLLGLLPIAVGSLLTVRRLAFHSYLLLDRDAFILPTGLLRVRTTQIPYIGIERVWQTRLPWMAVLCVATKGGKVEVLSGMLPDTSSYIAVGNFLNSRAQDNLKNTPECFGDFCGRYARHGIPGPNQLNQREVYLSTMKIF
jgi:hypothetical protein